MTYYQKPFHPYVRKSWLDEVLTGTERRDVLLGFRGDDTINALGGNDHVNGGKGDDSIDLGDGNDIGIGGKGDDTISLGAGHDRAFGGLGDDRIILGDGRNLVDGGRGFDIAEAVGGFDDYHITFRGCHYWQTTFLTRKDAGGTVLEHSRLMRVEQVEFDDFTLFLDGRNNAVFARDDVATTDEDSALTLAVAELLANDVDVDGDDILLLDVAPLSAAGAQVTLADGVIHYDPGDLFQSLGTGQTATDTITYSVGDGKGGVDRAEVTVTVTGVNDAARIDGPDSASVAENTTEVAQFTASDPDSETVGFAITGGADAALFTIADDGTLSFIDAPDFEAPGDADEENSYEVEVTARDDEGAGSSKTITVTVTDVAEVPVLISEFLPNPTGSDPSTTQVELSGGAGAAFSGYLIAIESDPGGANPGDVNSFEFVSGTFDANGLLTVTIADLENPSFTLVLADDFTGDESTDFDTDNDGVADDASTLGTVLDAIGVADTTGEPLYGAQLGGTDLAFSGDEPRLVFRDGASNALYAVNDPDGGAVIDADGNSLSPADFSFDPLNASFGAANPVFDGTGGPDARPTPYSFDFEVNFASEGWQAVSVDSDAANTWFANSGGEAEVNAFADDAAANDWLISPLLDLSGLTTPVASFVNEKRFEDNGLADPELSFLWSADYSGSGDPSLATWTALPFTFADSGTAAESGLIDLSGLPAGPVYFAFQYQSSGTGPGSSAGWRVDDVFIGNAPVVEPPTAQLISTVQGSGASSAFVGQTVTVEAIVVGDFQSSDADDSRNLNGFFLQEEAADADGDAATSEGIFVFADNIELDLNLGDKVRVTGIVSEFFEATQISASAVEMVEAGAVADIAAMAATVDLDAAAAVRNGDGDFIADLEAYEGMLITLPETLTVTEAFNLDRFGEVRLTAGDRPDQFTQNNAPDAAGFEAHLADTFSDFITYDDGLRVQTPDTFNTGFDFDGDGRLTTADGFGMGDTVSGLTGVLDYSFDAWRVHSVRDGDNSFVDTQTRDADAPSLSDPVTGRAPEITVTSFNVLNFFTTIDGTGLTSGPGGLDPRGADSTAEYERQLEKLVTTLTRLDADIFGLVELENEFQTDQNGDGLVAINALVDAMNAASRPGTWAAVDPGRAFVDTSDAISVGMIYKTNSVTVVGEAQILDDSVLASLPGDYGTGAVFDGPSTNRAPLAATFEYAYPGGTEQFTVAVTHMKSKGGTGTGGDADQGDGAGNFNETRDEGTRALIDWLDGFADPDQLVLGDFNAYKQEDPVKTMAAAGYVNLEESFDPGTDTFVFDGQTGTLDYAFASGAMLDKVTGAGAWNINSNEPDLYDYNLDSGRPADAFDGTVPFRSSDHDPVSVGLSFGDLIDV